MWWEFGERLARTLGPIAAWLPAKWQCRCEARREWCNQKGENLWKRLAPRSAARLRSRFRAVVLLKLDVQVTPEGQLHALLHRLDIRICVRTMRRWMKTLPVKTVKGREILYGLPYDC